jgi:hypothetical protein
MGSRNPAPLGSAANVASPSDGILARSEMQPPASSGLRPAHPLDRTRHLLCDHPSPVRSGARVKYELFQYGAEIQSANTKESYRWSLIDTQQDLLIYSEASNARRFNVEVHPVGEYRVQVEVYLNGLPSKKVYSREHHVISEDTRLAAIMQDPALSTNAKVAYRELIAFQSYIVQSARKADIPARFLAAVLYVEIYHRWSEREREIDQVRRNLAAQNRGDWFHFPNAWPLHRIDLSIGVGQVRLSTAAMVSGAIAWMDQDRANRQPARDRIARKFNALSIGTKLDLFEQLRWPEGNIDTAAQLLSRLKNRPNRYPEMSSAEFARDERAVGVLATEYNAGPTDSEASEAAPSGYGKFVWERMNNDPIITSLF